jgi:hypothetical protein
MGMNRLFIGLALVGLLAACTTQGDGTTDAPIGSTDAESTGAPDGTSTTATPACEEAFAPLAGEEIASISELGDLVAELEPTIETCESVDDWIAGAQTVVAEDINPSTARLLLGIQCNDPGLANSPVCQELASS